MGTAANTADDEDYEDYFDGSMDSPGMDNKRVALIVSVLCAGILLLVVFAVGGALSFPTPRPTPDRSSQRCLTFYLSTAKA